MNTDLNRVGSNLRISKTAPPDPHRITLVDTSGVTLGDVPSDVDADTIVAFETILSQRQAQETAS